MYIICWNCKRSVTPHERIEKDIKTGKHYSITACPYERCKVNFDIEEISLKLWNDKNRVFEGYDANKNNPYKPKWG